MDDFKRQLSNSFGLMPELQAANKSENVNIFDNKFKNRKKNNKNNLNTSERCGQKVVVWKSDKIKNKHKKYKKKP